MLLLAVCAALLSSCGKREAQHPRLLSQWKIFNASSGKLAELEPVAAAIRYELRTPLFSDYANKDRVVLMPTAGGANRKAGFNEFAVYDFPIGTVIAKTFSYGGRRVETRILVNEKAGWVGLPYVWNKEQTDAVLELVPDPVQVSYVHPASGETETFEYNIPNSNQCKACHENAGVMKPIGPKSRHLDPVYTERLTGVANVAPAPLDTLDDRARAYLDINCAHCHNTKGPANTTGLVLTYGETDPAKLGVCKTPVAAGQGSGTFRFSIVPGRPDESILIHRMRSTAPKVQMPELGRSIVHREGVALIREWIASLKGGCEVSGVYGLGAR